MALHNVHILFAHIVHVPSAIMSHNNSDDKRLHSESYLTGYKYTENVFFFFVCICAVCDCVWLAISMDFMALFLVADCVEHTHILKLNLRSFQTRFWDNICFIFAVFWFGGNLLTFFCCCSVSTGRQAREYWTDFHFVGVGHSAPWTNGYQRVMRLINCTVCCNLFLCK